MKQTKTMKKLWLAALLVALLATLLCLSAGAETVSGTCGAEGDNLTWTLDTATGELIISGEGEMADYSSTSSVPWNSYSYSINTVIIDDGVASIGNYSFSDCFNIISVTIPNGVITIGKAAFSRCGNLEKIILPNSVLSIGYGAFGGCRALTSIIIPESVSSIGEQAFFACSSLAEIVIEEGVVSIGKQAFFACSSLVSIILPDSITTVEERAFGSCENLESATIGSGLTNISASMFNYCSKLSSVTIENGVASIDDYAFDYCSNLKEILIPESVISVGIGIFYGCSNLESIKVAENNTIYHSAGNCIIETKSKTLVIGCKKSIIPTDDSVTSIDGSAFWGCSELTSIFIPQSITSIGMGIFYGCSDLASIIVDENNSVYHSKGNCIIETQNKLLIAGCKNSVIPSDSSVAIIYPHSFAGCSNLETIVIPNGITYIGNGAFSDCIKLKEIIIPSTVTNISDYAFEDCSSLENVIIENGANNIGTDAFRNCTNLSQITLPNSVATVNSWAFYNCSNLAKITILSKTTEIYDSLYTFPHIATIYGYTGSTAEAYASKYGRTFVALDETEELIDGSLVGFQVTKGENGEFSLRAIAGLNSLDYKNFGYEITITTKDEDGNDVVKTLSGTSTKAYSSIYGGDTEYSIKEHFGYEYAGLATVTGLAVDSSYTKIEIRSFVTTLDGKVKYGKSGTLLYTGTLDDGGYPYFEAVTE